MEKLSSQDLNPQLSQGPGPRIANYVPGFRLGTRVGLGCYLWVHTCLHGCGDQWLVLGVFLRLLSTFYPPRSPYLKCFVCMADAFSGQKRAPDPLGLELQMVERIV